MENFRYNNSYGSVSPLLPIVLLQNSKIKSLVKTEAKVLPMTPEQEKQRKLEKRKNKLRYCNWH